MHLDKHVVKMIVEYAQLLSTAHRMIDGTVQIGKNSSGRKTTYWTLPDERELFLYKSTHVNHPSCRWARESSGNYEWLYELFCCLCDEYTYRYGKKHMTDQKLRMLLKKMPKNIPRKSFVEPYLAMPDEVKINNNTIESYRNYYIQNKKHFAKWTKREVPFWFTQGININNAHL